MLVAGGLVAAALLVSNAGQARLGVAAHPAEASVMGGHGPSLERGGGWQHLTPLYLEGFPFESTHGGAACSTSPRLRGEVGAFSRAG